MSQYDPNFKLRLNLGHCDLYSTDHLLYILKSIWCTKFNIMYYDSVCPEVWPKINLGHSNLHFAVQ